MKVLGIILGLFFAFSLFLWFITQFTGIEPAQAVLTFIAIGIGFIAMNSFEIVNKLRKLEQN